ncbi:hypothetical protein FSARC_2867 [Fusarium sarcochroum]|uniref:BZIP domain-containing protein n=1 Tax=Fusarium sarcochroum TaxID=1208366 RepID=A0A8H4U5R0_9HYPO|nr:hypothetical protein FSARC_2867 [Fusarium sarcochroum]
MSDVEPEITARTAPSRKRSRAVSNLTEEQIQHKRNVDRKAQRAFRQRNKACITNLEQHFSQLQGTCAELRESCNQKSTQIDHMRQENKSLQECLRNISELITVALSQAENSHNQDQDQDQDQSLAESQSDQTSGDQSPGQTPDVPQDNEMDSLSATHQDVSSLHQDTEHVIQPDSEEQFDNHLAPCQTPPGCTGHTVLIHDQPHTMSNVMSNENTTCHVSPSANAGLLSPAGSYQPTTASSHIPYCASQLSVPESNLTQQATASEYSISGDVTAGIGHYTSSNAVYTILPSHGPPSCPLDLILLEFLKSRKEMLSNSMDPESIVGPRKPSTRAIVNIEQVDTVHPLSGIMSRVLSTFPSVQMAEKLGFFYLMCHTMKWQIHPTKQHYTCMPSWLRPTITQIATPHAAWIDNIPWPGVRDILIENQAEYPFQLFSDYYSQNVSVNWKFDGLDAISDLDGEGTLHSIFEKHIRNLKNWTVSQAFEDRFPSMVTAIYSRD